MAARCFICHKLQMTYHLELTAVKNSRDLLAFLPEETQREEGLSLFRKQQSLSVEFDAKTEEHRRLVKELEEAQDGASKSLLVKREFDEPKSSAKTPAKNSRSVTRQMSS